MALRPRERIWETTCGEAMSGWFAWMKGRCGREWGRVEYFIDAWFVGFNVVDANVIAVIR